VATTVTAATVRPLRENDLPSADKIMRQAFGTFIGLPDPLAFAGDAAYIRPRWFADPHAALGVELGGELVGSNFVTNWGSVGFFGPLTIRPDLWDQGLAKQLLEQTMELFAQWGTQHAGLYTFPGSPKHIGLYQKFGFQPRFLTMVMAKLVNQLPGEGPWTRYSKISVGRQAEAGRACRDFTHAIYDGLDIELEIRAVETQKLGDTVLLWDSSQLVGVAVCHWGAGTEAGSGTCYVKFGAVRPGPYAEQDFVRLLTACEQLAATQGLSRLLAGVNTARHEAYQLMLGNGFRIEMTGLIMQKPNEPGYNRPGVYVIDDWR
jgi:GNAT superfamily N-acetyltransferase